MKLTTPVPIKAFDNPVDYDSKLVLLGSCFAENIGEKLQYFGFQTIVNPLGIIYNPVALAQLVTRACSDVMFTEDDLIEHEEIFKNLGVHSQFNSRDKEEALVIVNHAIKELSTAIKEATHLFITLGTAWVYEYKATATIVANCNKIPSVQFNKKLLTSVEVSEALLWIKEAIHSVNSNCKITYTISPVRHIKDGITENLQSKSRLLDAVLSSEEVNATQYFPAYEIVMDELRDYRFYGRDLVHLNEIGVDYVWDRFRESVINKSTVTLMKQVDKYRKLAAHRPLETTHAEAHLDKVAATRADIEKKLPAFE